MEYKLQQAADQWDKTPEEQKHNIQVVPLDTVLSLYKELRERSIIWSVEDFESRAIDVLDLEEGDESWKEIYDEDKFDHALTTMIHDHDCNNGITWDTIDYYLDEYCKK